MKSQFEVKLVENCIKILFDSMSFMIFVTASFNEIFVEKLFISKMLEEFTRLLTNSAMVSARSVEIPVRKLEFLSFLKTKRNPMIIPIIMEV